MRALRLRLRSESSSLLQKIKINIDRWMYVCMDGWMDG